MQCRKTIYLRGIGGFSKSSHPYSYSKNPASQNVAAKIPKSQPFAVFEECTQPSQACSLFTVLKCYNDLCFFRDVLYRCFTHAAMIHLSMCVVHIPWVKQGVRNRSHFSNNVCISEENTFDITKSRVHWFFHIHYSSFSCKKKLIEGFQQLILVDLSFSAPLFR